MSDWQEEIALCPARFQFCAGGRKVGQTHLAGNAILLRSMRQRNHKTMYASPVSSQHDEIVDHILNTPGADDVILRTRTRPFRILFKNGSSAEFRAFEKSKNIRSRGVHYLILDESQDIKEKAFETVARPLVSAHYGSILLLGQFRGMDWRYKKFFEPGQAAPGCELNPVDFGTPRYKSWKIPTSMGPSFQGERGQLELEIAKSQMSAWSFAVEFLCEICSNPSAAFRAENLERIIKGTSAEPRPRTPYVIGLDIGKVVDPSAAVILNVATGQVEL